MIYSYASRNGGRFFVPPVVYASREEAVLSNMWGSYARAAFIPEIGGWTLRHRHYGLVKQGQTSFVWNEAGAETLCGRIGAALVAALS